MWVRSLVGESQIPRAARCRQKHKKIKVKKLIVVQSLSRVRLFESPWAAALQAPLPYTISPSLLSFLSIESVMQIPPFKNWPHHLEHLIRQTLIKRRGTGPARSPWAASGGAGSPQSQPAGSKVAQASSPGTCAGLPACSRAEPLTGITVDPGRLGPPVSEHGVDRPPPTKAMPAKPSFLIHAVWGL